MIVPKLFVMFIRARATFTDLSLVHEVNPVKAFLYPFVASSVDTWDVSRGFPSILAG